MRWRLTEREARGEKEGKPVTTKAEKRNWRNEGSLNFRFFFFGNLFVYEGAAAAAAHVHKEIWKENFPSAAPAKKSEEVPTWLFCSVPFRFKIAYPSDLGLQVLSIIVIDAVLVPMPLRVYAVSLS
jgi:hypothetical protein